MDSVLNYNRDPDFESAQKRGVRIPARWRVVVIGAGQKRAGRSVNVAPSGVALHCEHTLPIGWSGDVFLEVPSQTPAAQGGMPLVLRFPAKVAYAVHDSASRCFRIGMQFADVDKDTEAKLIDELIKRYPSQARSLR
ncbi:hypothetical protein HNQ50_003753 [Silvimonas terrae]|uniref:PilZ domain-containing protein n=1 Tax=Silvimonas terrae TaxID=300266 RepID=A0A840RH89_9NEIS|nr:PilZ domain-containing protein [Silvimonas terrae]MBB5192999.1 hypothetical protein [Silvimonas terrae]